MAPSFCEALDHANAVVDKIGAFPDMSNTLHDGRATLQAEIAETAAMHKRAAVVLIELMLVWSVGKIKSLEGGSGDPEEQAKIKAKHVGGIEQKLVEANELGEAAVQPTLLNAAKSYLM